MREHIVPTNRGLNRGLHIIQRHGTLALSISCRKISSRSQKARFLIGSNPCCCKCKSWACRYEGKCAQSTSDKVGDLNPTPRRFSKVKGTQRVGKVLLENAYRDCFAYLLSQVLCVRQQPTSRSKPWCKIRSPRQTRAFHRRYIFLLPRPKPAPLISSKIDSYIR